jgi:hypothetical protein
VPTTFKVEALPFYRKVKLVRAQVDLPHRPLEFRYADGGPQLVYLSGDPGDVYRANDLDGLALGEGQVGAYLRFFFEVTRGPEGRQQELAEGPGDLVWLPGTESDAGLKAARTRATGLLRPVRVSAAAGGYGVIAAVAEGRRLLELTLRVDAKGRVTVESTKVLLEDLPVAETL